MDSTGEQQQYVGSRPAAGGDYHYHGNPPRYNGGVERGRGYGRGFRGYRGRGYGRGLNFRDRQESRPCKFFAQGQCKFGENCRNQHIEGSTQPKPCKFFAQGQCKFGENCRNIHGEASN